MEIKVINLHWSNTKNPKEILTKTKENFVLDLFHYFKYKVSTV